MIWSLLSTQFYVFPLFYVFLHVSYFFLCRDAQFKYFHPLLTSALLHFSESSLSSSVMFLVRLSAQSCTQSSWGEGKSEVYKSTINSVQVVFWVCNICIQRTVSPSLESLRSSQDLMMWLIHYLLKWAKRQHLCVHSLFPSFYFLAAIMDMGLKKVSCSILKLPSVPVLASCP